MMAVVASVALAVAAASPASAPAIPPPPTHWVTDNANFLSPATRDALDARLASYAHATGHQVIVWIDRTLGGAPLDDWAVRTFASWKVGRKGFDDGVAMFIFAEDRAIDIEVGYGLEPKLTDAAASRIIREVMTPRLRAGDRDGAVTAGVESVLAVIEGKPWTPIATQSSDRGGPSALAITLGALAGLGFLLLLVTHPRLAMMLLWTFASSGRGGGGGLGGFGGGGGRSGGGGARGRW